MINVRVYGLCIHNQHILVCQEPFQGRLVTKFPGGGLEFGEGPEETLVRELLEETGQHIQLGPHVYTTGFFIRSLRHPEEQLLSIYYRFFLPDPQGVRPLPGAEPDLAFQWLSLDTLDPALFELPADQYVARNFLLPPGASA
jgi:8-oxo-dGTP pyrophosphatase MutT (NUDIX family)